VLGVAVGTCGSVRGAVLDVGAETGDSVRGGRDEVLGPLLRPQFNLYGKQFS